MKHLFILNPAAGRADSTAALTEKIRASFGDAAEVYETTGVGDATRFVRSYAEQHPEEQLRFYACGGDGTLSEVVNGVVGCDHAAVGLVPVGTGNDFVRNFTNTDQFHSMDAQKDGREITIDLLRCNDHYCINMLNTGFDCEVVERMEKIKRRVPSGMAYALGVVIELIRKPGVTLELTVDGRSIPCGKMLLCAVGNGGCYGGGFHPLPMASVNDGYMDVCLVKNVSRTRFLTLIGSYKKGTHINPKTEKILTVLRCRSLQMKFPEPRAVSIDGELPMMQNCDVSVIPGALRFVLPAGSDPIGQEKSNHDD